MWFVMLMLWLISAIGVESAPAPSAPCADWESRFQESLTRATVPEVLNRVLAVHQGHGFATRFTETKHIGLLRRPLRATGQLIFIPPQGLYRQLQSPFEQELF